MADRKNRFLKKIYGVSTDANTNEEDINYDNDLNDNEMETLFTLSEKFNYDDDLEYTEEEKNLIKSMIRQNFVVPQNIEMMEKKAVIWLMIGVTNFYCQSESVPEGTFYENVIKYLLLASENGLIYAYVVLGNCYLSEFKSFENTLNCLEEEYDDYVEDFGDDEDFDDDEFMANEDTKYGLNMTTEEIMNYLKKTPQEKRIYINEQKLFFKMESEKYFLLYLQNHNSFNAKEQIASFYYIIKDYTKAKEYYLSCVDIYDDEIEGDDIEFYRSLSYIFKVERNYKMAQIFLKKYKLQLIKHKIYYALKTLNNITHYYVKCPICRQNNSFDFLKTKLKKTGEECCICMTNDVNSELVKFNKCKHAVCCMSCVEVMHNKNKYKK